MSVKIQQKYKIELSELENFIREIDGFFDLKPGEQIQYFVFFLTIESNKHAARPIEIKKCFELLHVSPYSNISLYLSNGLNKDFIKNSTGYLLQRSKRNEIEEQIGKASRPKPTNSLFPLTLVKDTRGYIEEIAKQAIICYDLNLTDTSFVMIRKLLETLIIESFERHNLQDKIKSKCGDYLFLRDLITKFLNEKRWKLGREVKNGLPKIKKLADQSAHNRRFVAQKDDIDKLKSEIRLIVQELVNLIDYQDWNKELRSS